MRDAGRTDSLIAAPPVGRTTVLLTDIEGSTRLARARGAQWPTVVDDHHRLLESAITARGGFVERTAGDSFFALFGDPVQAVGAAVDARRSLSGHRWPERVSELRVRMGLHTGMVDRSERELIGLDINLALIERLRAAGEQAVLGLGLRITSITRLGPGDHDSAVSESGEALNGQGRRKGRHHGPRRSRSSCAPTSRPAAPGST